MNYRLFSKGDINVFWVLFADNLANFLIIIGICTFVFNMPNDIVFNRIIPGLGIAVAFGAIVYAFMAKSLAKKENRNDVTALPYGISTPVMFVYLFGVIGPIYWATNDALLAWQVGIAAGLIGSLVSFFGIFVGPFLQKAIPRAGMLGTLCGIAITFIASVAFARIYEQPIIGILAFGIISWGLIAKFKLPFNLPAGLVAIVIGIIIAIFLGEANLSFEAIGFYPPIPWFGDMAAGIKHLFINPALLAVLIPVQLYNMIETMNNVEAAKSVGDDYSIKQCQFVDGCGTALGALFGSPFPTTVYIGHPACKSLGAHGGYSIATAIVFLIASTFGLTAFISGLVPEVVLAPILVFVGIAIIATSFEACKKEHFIAIGIAFLPHLSAMLTIKWNSMLNALGAMGIKDLPTLNEMAGVMHQQGAFVLGHQTLAHGAIITGMLWGGMTAYLIDKEFLKSCYLAIASVVLSGFGIIHYQSLGWFDITSQVAWGYVILALIFGFMHYTNPDKIQPQH